MISNTLWHSIKTQTPHEAIFEIEVKITIKEQ